MDPPPNPPAYEDERDVNYDEELLLDRYDEIPVSRMDKLKKWKQLIIDPCVEVYGYLLLKWELMLAKLGNPLIVKRVLYVLFISLLFYALSFTGVLPSDSSGYIGFTDHKPLIESINIDYKLLEESLEYLMSVDHSSGTNGDIAVAEYVNEAFKQSRMQTVQMQEMRTLLNFPGESFIKYDDVTVDVSNQFNPFSFNDEVSGNLIYLNNGFQSDYDLFSSNNVNLEGNIGIITINEKIPVSQTCLLAQSKGLKGLIFVDEDIGQYEDEFQRLSVAIPQFYTGDPLTPGWSSSMIATRLKFDETTMLKIPTISLSRKQIKPLLEKLNNKGIKFSNGLFSGSLDHEITLSNNVTYQQDHSIWNILGKFEGKEQPDKALFIGAQRDSICPNGLNPNSGISIMIQLIKILTEFNENFNWKPLRSIYFLSFDASEYNYAGITELIEAKSHEIRKEAIAYIDLSGELITDSEELDLFTNGLLFNLMDSYKDEFNLTIKENFDNYDNFIPFMNLGIPILKPQYLNSGFKCQTKFKDLNDVDTAFKKHTTLIKLLTRVILNLIDDPLIPFNLNRYVDSLDHHLHNLEDETSKKFDGINFNPLISALLRLKQIGKDFEMWEHAWKDLVSDDSGIEPSLLSVHRWNWNARLNTAEKSMIDGNGNGVGSSRKWFRNVLSGPQLIKPEEEDADWFSFPSIRDILSSEQSTRGELEEEIKRVGDLILKGCEIIVS